MQALFVFSHLRWNFVYQRPQHLLSRLSRHMPVLYLEEPEYRPGPARLVREQVLPGLTVLRPQTPIAQGGFHAAQMPALRTLLRPLCTGLGETLAWFYTPMALPLLDLLPARHVVYDCMDELAAFHQAPAGLRHMEAALLQRADIVFAGGPSLYRARRRSHANVHCLPSSVDAAHFRRALRRDDSHPAQAGLPRPRLGFYGVLDERFDGALVAAVADARPDWQTVLVGPCAKIDATALPQRPNIFYAGACAYDDLPRFLAGWDACLMPFAMNEATRSISPTKSLEYMAAELPIVSTPVPDVVELHDDVVRIAAAPAAFVDACAAALGMDGTARAAMLMRMRAKLAQTSWQATAARMLALLQALDAPAAAAPRLRSVAR